MGSEAEVVASEVHPRRFFSSVVAATVGMVLLGVVPALAGAGDLDPGFGTGGRVTTLFPNGSYATALAVLPDGGIVAVGAAAGASMTGEFAVARYGTDGVLDPGFDADGMVTTAIAGGGDEARSVAVQPDGRIVVAGTDSRRRFAVVRYLSDGGLDPSFGGDGIVRTELTTGEDIGYDIAIQDDGKIVVVGSAATGTRFAIVRYRRTGELDRTFGDHGAVLIARGDRARSVALDRDGRIVVAGYNGWGLTVVRLGQDGRLDASFGGDGIVDRIVSQIFGLAVAVQPNDKIVVAGDYDIFRTGIARLTRDGGLDPTFGQQGVRRVRFGAGEQNFTGLAVQDDGRILAVGHVGPHEYGDPIEPQIIVARFLRTGALDVSWGGDGKLSTTFPGGASASGIALQPDGMPVVAGEAGQGDAWGFALARYLG